jgi:hypothetical protein
MDAQTNFLWKCQPQAESFIQNILDEAIKANVDIATLQEELTKQTSTRLFDWLDHVIVGDLEKHEKELEAAGFVQENVSSSYRVFHHPGAQLPRVVLRDHDRSVVGIAVSVELIADFLMVRGKTGWIEGSPLSSYRRCLYSTDNEVSLWVVERRGTLTMEPSYPENNDQEKYIEAMEQWQTRPRCLDNEDEAFERTITIVEGIIHSLGVDLAAWVVLEAERKYWQARNLAGQLQKGRQDRLGMGWANHDHHTFRSSRRHFHQLVRLFEMLGFHCRERFYAGAEAGWGAQVMENPRAKLVLFLDVDLAPQEIEVDFAHHPLPELPTLGTIGLWCALHGDSILRAGMHHLEAQFLFEELTQDLHKAGIGMMTPFSHFPYLKQAFTQGEVWRVCPQRIAQLLQQKKITLEQADKFLAQGAVGSHMENLQRREGYKGFNQKNVSVIIKETDPRHLQV